MCRQTSTCGQLAFDVFSGMGRYWPASCACPSFRLPPSSVSLLPDLQMLNLLRDPSQVPLEVAVLPCLQMLELWRGWWRRWGGAMPSASSGA